MNILMKMASLKDQAIRDQLKINHLKAWPYKCHLLTVLKKPAFIQKTFSTG